LGSFASEFNYVQGSRFRGSRFLLVLFDRSQRLHALLPALQQDSAPSWGRLFFCLRIEAPAQPGSGRAGDEFHRLSRKLHPDRFARAAENEKQWSLADTALLNDAYRTLKDPLHRTEYLLKLEGADSALEADAAKNPGPIQAQVGNGRKDPLADSRRSARRGLRSEHAVGRDARVRKRGEPTRSCSQA
jgi:hypothetical protein